jgi:hypothetical protein
MRVVLLSRACAPCTCIADIARSAFSLMNRSAERAERQPGMHFISQMLLPLSKRMRSSQESTRSYPLLRYKSSGGVAPYPSQQPQSAERGYPAERSAQLRPNHEFRKCQMHYAILRLMLGSSERVHQCQPCCLRTWSFACTLLPCASVSQVDFQDPVDGSLRLVLQSSTCNTVLPIFLEHTTQTSDGIGPHSSASERISKSLDIQPVPSLP